MRAVVKVISAFLCGTAAASLGGEPTSAAAAGAAAGSAAADYFASVAEAARSALGAISGNLAHEAWNEGEQGLLAAVFSSSDIDRNHHVILALRKAHLDALEQVLKEFDSTWPTDPDQARKDEAQRFAGELTRYVQTARRGDAGTGLSPEERTVLGKLPAAFDAALAARTVPVEGEDESQRTLMEAVMSEIIAAAGTTSAEIPPAFRSLFVGDRASMTGNRGWFDPFVQAAADELQKNEAFRSIWTAQQLAAMRRGLDESAAGQRQLKEGIQKVSIQLETAEHVAERRHAELMAKSESLERLQHETIKIASQRHGIPLEKLARIMGLVGQADAPIDQWPDILFESYVRLKEIASRELELHGDSLASDAAINEARAALKETDVAGALNRLDRALDEDEGLARASAAEEQARLHREAMAAARARLFFEKADILSSVFDHEATIAALNSGLMLCPDDIRRWGALGDELRIVGRRPEALAAYWKCLALAESFGALNPSDIEGQRDLWFAHDKIGSVLSQMGDRAGAREAYRAGLRIAQRLVARHQSNLDLQHHLSVSYERVGDLLSQDGDLDGALAAYRASLAVREYLADCDPNQTNWQRDLSINYNRIGDVLGWRGDRAGAREAYQAGCVIMERLVLCNPDNLEWQRDLSISRDRLSGFLSQEGQRAGLLVTHQKGLKIAEWQALLDPSNTEWQRDLAVSHTRIGEVLGHLGDATGALEAYFKSLKIMENLAVLDPGNSQWQRDLAVVHHCIGNLQRDTGDWASALTAYQKGLLVLEKLAPLDPRNAEWQRDLSITHDGIGDVRRQEGKLNEALAEYLTSLKIRRGLADLDPNHPGWQRDISISHNKIGDVLSDMGDLAGALEAYRAGLKIAECLAVRDPVHLEWQRDLSVSHLKVGDILRQTGDTARALVAGRAALAIRERLAVIDSFDARRQRDLVVALQWLAILSPPDEAELLESALAITRRLANEGKLTAVEREWQADLQRRINNLNSK